MKCTCLEDQRLLTRQEKRENKQIFSTYLRCNLQLEVSSPDMNVKEFLEVRNITN
jgi:hypothetical protein